MLSVKKILAGRGAVDYYLNQARRGLADYYLPETTAGRGGGDGKQARLTAPGSRWWGGGAEALGLSGPVQRAQFVPLYAKGARPDGSYLGRKFRTQEQAAQARATALDDAAAISDPFERWQVHQRLRRGGIQASVAAWDCTFSPVKSVSLLWAACDRHVQFEVWAAHLAAVDAGLDYLQEHAAYVRAGRNGTQVLETSGLTVARMNEWTSRDGDMHLHTHCLILNRAQTATDGRWRALDGRALLAAKTGASAVYHRVLEAELTRRLAVAWRDRDDGLRELDGVDDDLIAAFSTRRRAITDRLQQMSEAYEARYGVPPPPTVVYAMAQDATVATRRHKTDPTPDDALTAWEATARKQGQALTALPRKVLGRAPRHDDTGSNAGDVAQMLSRLESGGRASFTRHDLVRAAFDVVPVGAAAPEQLQARASRLVDELVAAGPLISVTAPDPVEVPPGMARSDGTSIYQQPERHRWALPSTLDREAWLLDVAGEPTGRPVDRTVINQAVTDHRLGGDQASAIRELLTADRRIGLLVGPAGAGKTRTLRAAVAAWEADGGHVLGLTVSQAAAQVLATEAQVRAENTAKWLFESRRATWRLPDRPLLLIDEASMVATADLVTLVEQVRQAGGKVLLVGDPAQLSAIHIGGAFDLLAERHGTAHLHEIRRFADSWEADASLKLRQRDPDAISAYAMRGRIHDGRLDHLEADLFDAWRADALGTDHAGRRQTVMMIVTTNEQGAILGERARTALVAAGHVAAGPTVQLADNVASVGDHLVTRRNDRRLATSGTGWVVNGDVWTVTAVHPNGDADVRRHSDAATIQLPADYLADHTHLAYATTAHRAQGMTVDICHAVITADTSHQQLYVAATRGRTANHLWVAVDSDRDLIRDDTHLPTPEQLLDRSLKRRDPDRLSASQTAADSVLEMTSLARLGAILEDAARRATDRWLQQTLASHGLDEVADDPKWASLLDRTRQLALAGHDVGQLLADATSMRPIDDARSRAGVLHWRLGWLASHMPQPRGAGPLTSLPPSGGTDLALARQVGELIRQRWSQIRDTLDDTQDAPMWAAQLGPPPAEAADRRSWLTAATAAAAYRERYELPDHTTMIGERPARTRPDAQAAWDHARLQADRYLARRLHHLDGHDLDQLQARQQSIIDRKPDFDPTVLAQARQAADAAVRAWRAAPAAQRPQTAAARNTAMFAVARLERAAARHAQWRRDAAAAEDLCRHISHVRRRASAHATAARTTQVRSAGTPGGRVR